MLNDTSPMKIDLFNAFLQTNPIKPNLSNISILPNERNKKLPNIETLETIKYAFYTIDYLQLFNTQSINLFKFIASETPFTV